MIRINVKRFVEDKEFEIVGVSYIGTPKSNTAMFMTRKVGHLLSELDKVDECLVFAENGMEVPKTLIEKHAFHFSDHPQLSYVEVTTLFEEERFVLEKKSKFHLTMDGYYLNEDVEIPEDAYIEPGCVIGPDVQIGEKAIILAGTIIRHASIGNSFLANQNAVIGANGFTMTEDEIGNNVEVGSNNNISCGSAGDTILEDNVKLDTLIHVGHDVHLHRNVEVTAGVTIGGFVEAEEGAYIGIGSILRNRIDIGEKCVIGMGSNVTKSVEPKVVVVGNPAKPFTKSYNYSK